MEALSLTSEIVSEPSCSLALTDDSLPDDTHTLLLSAPESNVHAQPLTAPPASPGAGLAAGLQVPPFPLSQPHNRRHLVPQALLGVSRVPPLWTKKLDNMKLGPPQEGPRGYSCERVNPDPQE